MVLVRLDLLLQLVKRDLVVLDDQVDLQLLDAEADGDKLGGAPDKAVHLNGADTLLELLHAGLVVPRLDVEGDDGLGGGLHLSLLLLPVLGQALFPHARRLSVLLLVVAAEQVHVVVFGGILPLGRVDGHLAGLGAIRGVGLGRVAGQRRELRLERGNVLVPAVGVRVLLDWGRLGDGLEAFDVGLRRSVAL